MFGFSSSELQNSLTQYIVYRSGGFMFCLAFFSFFFVVFVPTEHCVVGHEIVPQECEQLSFFLSLKKEKHCVFYQC